MWNPFHIKKKTVNDIILYSLIVLSALGVLFAIILYYVAQKFQVVEDPRIDDVTSLFPGANCGGCGFAGCRALAEQIVKTNSLGIAPPCISNETLQQVAEILGIVAVSTVPKVAVVRCNGSFNNTPKIVNYDSTSSCFYANAIFSGESGCSNRCLGLGDCVAACKFDAIKISPVNKLPFVNENCIGCGACMRACPRHVIELRNRGPKDRRVWVSCVNTEKGSISRKNCSVSCIGCMKCVKVCAFDAIIVENNLAYIDFNKCKLCRKCVAECPTGAIHEINFPPRKEEPIVVETKTTEQ